MSLLIFQTFTLIGCCLILKYGKILNPIRDFLIKRSDFLKELFSCCMCLGFWVGIVWGYFFSGFDVFKIVAWGFYSSAVCWFADYATMVIDKYIDDDNVS